MTVEIHTSLSCIAEGILFLHNPIQSNILLLILSEIWPQECSLDAAFVPVSLTGVAVEWNFNCSSRVTQILHLNNCLFMSFDYYLLSILSSFSLRECIIYHR